MAPERFQSKKRNKNVLPNLIRAGSVAAVITAGSILPIQQAYSQDIDPIKTPINKLAESQSERISNFLDQDEIQIALGASFLGSIAALANSYYLGKKYDDKQTRLFRIAGPAFLSATTGSFLVDSTTTIPSEIPAGLLVGTALASTAYGIIQAYEHETNPAFRNRTLATAGLFISASALVFAAMSDKI